jgi:hypothetical protein
MPAPTAILKGGLDPVLSKEEAKLQEIRERILIVGVDGHPFRALGGRVDGIKADGDFVFEVATNCVQCQAKALAGFPVLGSVVAMSAAQRVRAVGL